MNTINLEKVFNRKQKEYLDIGISDVTKEVNDDYMILIASRPAMGKTSFLSKVAYGAAINNNKVAYFSLNKTKVDLIKSIVSVVVQCPKNKLVLSDYPNLDFKELYLYDKKYSLNELHNEIIKLDEEVNGLDLVIIDSIDELTGDSVFYKDICYLLSRLAYELKIHFMVSSNLNRNLEFREDKKPQINDLMFKPRCFFSKIIMLYRDDYYDTTKLYDGTKLDLDLSFYHINLGKYEKYNDVKVNVF